MPYSRLKNYLIYGLILSLTITGMPNGVFAAPAKGDEGPIVPGAPVQPTSARASVMILYKQASDYIARGQYKAAEPLVDEALKVDPAYFPLWKLKARILMHTNRYPQAEEAIYICIEKDPTDTEARILALQIVLSSPTLGAEEKGKKLNKIFEKMSEKSLTNLMFEFLKRDDARMYLPMLLTAWQQSKLGLQSSWNILDLYAKRQIPQAIDTLEKLEGNNRPPAPLLGALYYILGTDLAKSASDTKAIELLTKAQEAGFPAVDCVETIGDIHAQKKRFKEAADIWETRWREADKPDWWVVKIANARFETREFEKAANILMQGLNAFPKDILIQGKYLYTLHMLGKKEDQEKFELRLDGMNAQAGLAFGRALVFRSEGKMPQAQEEIKKAILFVENTSGATFPGGDFEEWLIKMAQGEGPATSATAQREALELRDRGWNYWQEKEYRKAYDVWMEAIDIGFPQVRIFIMNITMRLLEVGMSREAVALLKKHVPQVSPFAFAHVLGRQNRWDIVLPLLLTSPSDQYSPWNVLYRTYGALRMGNARAVSEGMEKLKTLPAPTKTFQLTGLDKQGRFVSYSLTPTAYSNLLANLGKEALKQKNPQLLIQMMQFPQWKNLAEKERAAMLAGAASEIIRQKDVRAFNVFLRSSEWQQLPSSVRVEFLYGAAKEILRQRDIPSFMNFIELPQWKELPVSMQNEILVAAGKEIVLQQATDLFPLFLDNPHWLQLPDSDRSMLLVEAGKILYRYGYDDKASPYFQAATQLDSGNGTAYLYLSLIETKLGNKEQAKAHLDKGLAGRSTEVDREYAQAMLELLNKNDDKAIEHFLAYLKLAPEDQLARYQAINLLVARYRFAEARALKNGFEEMYKKKISGIDAYVALTREEFGEVQQAEAIWANLATQHPERLNYLASWGSALNAQGKFERTIDLLAEPCRSTQNFRLATILAEATSTLEMYEDALEWVNIGLQTSSEDLSLLRFGAEAGEALELYDVAETYSSRFIQIQPDNASMQSLYGRSLMGQEKWEELHAHDKELLTKNKSNVFALDAETEYAVAKQIQTAGTSRTHKYLRMGRKIHQKILADFGQDPTSWSRYAMAAAGDAYYRGAIPAIQYLYEMGPNQAIAIFRYPGTAEDVSTSGIPIARIREQIDALQAAGHPIIGPDAIPKIVDPEKKQETPSPTPVLLLFNHMDKNMLGQLDALLEQKGITACLVIGEESLHPQTPIWPDKDYLLRLAANGRWSFLITDYAAKTLFRDEFGRTGPFWGTPRWLGDRLENEDEMYIRWRNEMARLKNSAESIGLKISGWVYPADDYGQLTIETSTPVNRAYKRAVDEVFTLGFAPTSMGFWVPHPDLWRLPMKNIYMGVDTTTLIRALTYRQPTRQAILDFAKILSWHGQLPRADRLFKKAADAGLDLKDVYYFHARNAQYEQDVPVALELAHKAVAEDPENPRVEKLMHDVEKLMHPQISVIPRYWWDSDGRRFYNVQTRYSWFTNEKTMLFAEVGLSRWEDENTYHIYGITPSFGARWYVKPEHWFEASAGITIMDPSRIDPIPSVNILWHGALNSEELMNMNGIYELGYNFGTVETLDSIESHIRRHIVTANASVRVANFWDVDTRLYASRFTDDNYSYGGSFRALYRFSEKPLLRAGYLFEAADSRFDPPQYYAPLGYMHHALALDFRYFFTPDVYINLYGTYGYARSQTRDWQQVWRTNVILGWRFLEDWAMTLAYRHLELPDYTLDEVTGSVYRTF